MMRELRKQWLNAALCLLALLLVGLTVWDRGRVSTDEALDRQHQLLDAWRVDDIGRLDIRFGDHTLQLDASRDADGVRSWSLTDNGQAQDVDEQAVGQYLQVLEFASHERIVSEDDRDKLGLSEPRLLLTVHMGALRYQLTIGAEAPSPAGGAYAEVDNGRSVKRYVIGAPLYQELTEALLQLRSKRLTPYVSTELASFQLSGPQVNWTLRRGGWGGRTAGSFLLQSPSTGDVRASRRTFDGWLMMLASAEVERFTELPPKAASGVHRLTLTPKDTSQPTAELELGGSCPAGGTLLVRRAPLPAAGCIDEQIASRLLVRPEKLVDNYVLGSAEGDVTELALDDLRGDGADIDVARKEESWLMRKPRTGEVEATPMNNWLARLVETQAERVPAATASDREALGLKEPRAKLTIHALPERGVDGAEERVEQLDVGTPVDGFVYLRRYDDDAVLKLTEDVAAAFVPRASTLRPTTLEDIPVEQVTGLRVACGLPEQLLERDIRGAWSRQDGDDKLGVDYGLASELTDQLRTLTALSWAADRAEPNHQLDKPWCRLGLRVTTADETRWVRVKLGAETQGGYFAQREGDAAVFVVPRALGSRASGWLLDRSGLLVDYSRVNKVTLRGDGDKTLTLTKQGDRWLMADNPSNQLALQVGRALEQLLAEAVVHVGPARPEDGMDAPRLRVSIELKGEAKPVELTVGAAGSYRQTNVALVRRSDVAATFAVGRARLSPLFDAL